MGLRYDENPLFILNSKCGDPRCGLLHPHIIEVECAAIILWADEPEPLAVVIQKKKTEDTGKVMYVAVAMEPFSFGHDEDNDDRLVVIVNAQGQGPDAISLMDEDLDNLKRTIDADAAHIYNAFYKKIPELVDGTEEAGDPTDLDGLDPSKMFRA